MTVAFETAFEEFMAATVSIEPVSTRDSYGKTTFGTAVDAIAKVSYTTSVRRDVANETVVVTAMVWLPPADHVPTLRSGFAATPTVTTGSRVTLPDGTARVVVSIDAPQDEDGAIHHQRLSLTG